jgi:hypothetical protein
LLGMCNPALRQSLGGALAFSWARGPGG